MLPDKNEHLHGLHRTVFLNLFLKSLPPCCNIRLVFFLETIHPQRRRKCKSGVFQAFLNGHAVALMNVAAAAAALDGHAAARAVKRDLLRLHRQHAVILQQHDAFCRGFAGNGSVRPLSYRFLRRRSAKKLKFHVVSSFLRAAEIV